MNILTHREEIENLTMLIVCQDLKFMQFFIDFLQKQNKVPQNISIDSINVTLFLQPVKGKIKTCIFKVSLF